MTQRTDSGERGGGLHGHEAASVHQRSVYHLPSWQGGDVITPRCERGHYWWTRRWADGPALSDDPARVTCARCLAMTAHGWPDDGPVQGIIEGGGAHERKTAEGVLE